MSSRVERAVKHLCDKAFLGEEAARCAVEWAACALDSSYTMGSQSNRVSNNGYGASNGNVGSSGYGNTSSYGNPNGNRGGSGYGNSGISGNGSGYGYTNSSASNNQVDWQSKLQNLTNPNEFTREVFDICLLAAKDGVALAQSVVGLAYLNGIHVQVDQNQAFQWLKRLPKTEKPTDKTG